MLDESRKAAHHAAAAHAAASAAEQAVLEAQREAQVTADAQLVRAKEAHLEQHARVLELSQDAEEREVGSCPGLENLLLKEADALRKDAAKASTEERAAMYEAASMKYEAVLASDSGTGAHAAAHYGIGRSHICLALRGPPRLTCCGPG